MIQIMAWHLLTKNAQTTTSHGVNSFKPQPWIPKYSRIMHVMERNVLVTNRWINIIRSSDIIDISQTYWNMEHASFYLEYSWVFPCMEIISDHLIIWLIFELILLSSLEVIGSEILFPLIKVVSSEWRREYTTAIIKIKRVHRKNYQCSNSGITIRNKYYVLYNNVCASWLIGDEMKMYYKSMLNIFTAPDVAGFHPYRIKH